MRILIVDDDVFIQKLLDAFLKTFGESEPVNSGKEAIDAVRKAFDDDNPFDLICLDIMMPGMDGHETLKAIRQLELDHGHEEDRAKVVMISAKGGMEEISQSFKEQCQAYLVKPIEKDQVVFTMRELGFKED